MKKKEHKEKLGQESKEFSTFNRKIMIMGEYRMWSELIPY